MRPELSKNLSSKLTENGNPTAKSRHERHCHRVPECQEQCVQVSIASRTPTRHETTRLLTGKKPARFLRLVYSFVTTNFTIEHWIKYKITKQGIDALYQVEIQFHTFLTSALHGEEWLSSPSNRFTLINGPLGRRLCGSPSRGGNIIQTMLFQACQ
jgi:hypothetical protein